MARSTENASLEREIGQRIMLLRGDETQEALAESVGVSREIIQHWERGTRHIKAGHLAALAQHFGCSVDYLLGLVPDKSPSLEVRGAIKLTGLSEGAVNFLLNMNGASGALKNDELEILSRLLVAPLDDEPQSPDELPLGSEVVTFGDLLYILSECRRVLSKETPEPDMATYIKRQELKKSGFYFMGKEAFVNAIIECEAVDRFRKLARFVVFGRDE